MTDYFAWHKETKEWLEDHPDEWQSIRYYVVECSDSFNQCGGTADRLGPMPLHVKIASNSGRLLLIRWTLPAPLETFLLPPQLGVDWRFPPWLVEKFQSDDGFRLVTMNKQVVRCSQNKKVRWVRVKHQTHDHGLTYYDAHRQFRTNDTNSDSDGEPTFDQVYHDLWRVLFTPAPAIADRIQQEMKTLKLIPGRYVSTHIRAFYGVPSREDSIVQWWAENAVRCATSKLPIYYNSDSKTGMPILFVSDASLATELASAYARKRGIEVLHRQHSRLPLHLEKANFTGDVTDFFDTFVDIYMIGMSRCTAYNMGNYAKWGSRIGYNASCVFHMKAIMERCDLTKQGRREEFGLDKNAVISTELDSNALFLPPMTTLKRSEKDGFPSLAKDVDSEDTNSFQEPDSMMQQENLTEHPTTLLPNYDAPKLAFYNTTQVMHQDPFLYTKFDNQTSNNLWAKRKKLPLWMKKYFRWHREQRQQFLTPHLWNDTSMKYIIMECLDHQSICGGAADRLKSLPTILRIAAWSNRLLLIHWTRPAKLEEFLLPPKGGVDWRVPDWMREFENQ